ncbi:DUF3352 domain-containing protein [Candidatus Peregrinibacteria bacterium]|nr:DUF3352 domain-containing protein [Candidatus Peregrinibacteria bacterium]
MRKKLIALAISGFLLMQPLFAFAASEATDLLPEDAKLLYTLNTKNPNPLEAFIEPLLTSGFTEEEADKLEAVQNLLFENEGAVALTSLDPNAEMLDMFIAFEMSEADVTTLEVFDNVVDMTEYNGVSIYNPSYELYAFQNEGLFFMTNTEENAKAALDQTTSFNDKEAYMNAKEYSLDAPFFTMFMEPSELLDPATIEELSYEDPFLSSMLLENASDLLSAIDTEYITVNQTADGFNMSVYVSGDENELTEKGYNFDQYDFVPNLYERINGEDVILYVEQGEFQKWLDSIEENLLSSEMFAEAYDEIITDFDTETGINLETEIFPMLDGEAAVAVHATDIESPAVTMIFDLGTNATEMTELMIELNNQIKADNEAMEADGTIEGYEYSIAHAGASFYKHEFIQDGESMVLYMNVVSGKLVISNHPTFESVYSYGEGMDENANFEKAFTNRNETRSNIVFVDLNLLTDLMKADMTEDEIQMMQSLFDSWEYLFADSMAMNAGESYKKLTLAMDTEMALNNLYLAMESLVDSLMASEPIVIDEPIFTDLDQSTLNYCDVYSSDWFYTYVEDLTMNDIVEGYNDGCFHPGDDVTRAEFTKMVLGAIEYKGTMSLAEVQTATPAFFSDISSEDWYAAYVNKAAANDIVDGYSDDSFKPNSPISRAEAVQVLYNASATLQSGTSFNPGFNDVEITDWFYPAVAAAYSNDLVDGENGAFNPARNINRAEAAKIISQYLSM